MNQKMFCSFVNVEPGKQIESLHMGLQLSGAAGTSDGVKVMAPPATVLASATVDLFEL